MLVVGYYNEFIFYEETLFVNYFSRQLNQSFYFSLDQSTIDAHGIEFLINFQVESWL